MNTENKFLSIDEVITGRRTIHQFKPDKVPPIEKIYKAIEVARWAPNHHVTQPWHFYFLGPQTIESIIELNTELVRGKSGEEVAQAKSERWSKVPGWMVLTCAKSNDSVRNQEDYAACCCAVQNFILYLWQEGIGVKWTTGDIIRDHRFSELIWIEPEIETVVGLFWYGYAEEIPQTTRKSVEQIITKLP